MSTTKIALNPDQVTALGSLLPLGTMGPASGFLYDGQNLAVPDTLVAQVQSVMAESNWQEQANAALLAAYAETKQTSIAQGGFTVDANSGVTGTTRVPVSVKTDAVNAGYLSSAVQLAQLMLAGTIPTADINWIQNGGTLGLTPTQMINVGVQVAALVQQSFTVLGQVLAALVAGSITTEAQIDTPSSPIPAWPVNS